MRSTLLTVLRSRAWLAVGLSVLTALALLIVFTAPTERTLGAAIRWVYVHVALTWTGMASLAVAGGLGLVLLVSGRLGLRDWMTTVGGLGLGFFAAGLVMSAFAAGATWGGMFWDEPRTRANLQVLAVGVIVVVAGPWLGRPRWQGVLFLALFAWMIVALAVAPLLLHPRNPILSSPSSAFRTTFASLFGLGALAAAWLTAHLRLRAPQT